MNFIPHISFKNTTKVLHDWLSGDTGLVALAPNAGAQTDFAAAAARKAATYPAQNRAVLVQQLREQLGECTPEEVANLELLAQGAYTVTTGHQLIVAGGVAFFEVKISHAIALAQSISATGVPTVPVFWMASEDHDFEEIASFSYGNRSFTWDCPHKGEAVGRLCPHSLGTQLAEFFQGEELTDLQRQRLDLQIAAYKTHDTLASATQAWVRQVFTPYGLLVLDGDDPALKATFQHAFAPELHSALTERIQEASTKIETLGYKPQVYTRDINLFTLAADSDVRKRVEQWSELEGLSPGEVSPNALFRPLYQEVLLPNLAYVGGGGELMYWMQLGGAFEALNIPMPALVLRHGVQPVSISCDRKLNQLGMTVQEVLESSLDDLVKHKMNHHHLRTEETAKLAEPLTKAVENWVEQTLEHYPELSTQVAAWAHKMHNLNIKTLKARYRVVKERNAVDYERINHVFSELKPNWGMWERQKSTLEMMAILGRCPIAEMVEKMRAENTGIWLLRS